MTSIEWLLEELKKVHHPTEAMIMYANKLHKQEILSAFTQGASDGFYGESDSNREKYYQETFGSKGSGLSEKPNNHINAQLPQHPPVISENGNELFFDEEGNLIKELPKQDVDKLGNVDSNEIKKLIKQAHFDGQYLHSNLSKLLTKEMLDENAEYYSNEIIQSLKQSKKD